MMQSDASTSGYQGNVEDFCADEETLKKYLLVGH